MTNGLKTPSIPRTTRRQSMKLQTPTVKLHEISKAPNLAILLRSADRFVRANRIHTPVRPKLPPLRRHHLESQKHKNFTNALRRPDISPWGGVSIFCMKAFRLVMCMSLLAAD